MAQIRFLKEKSTLNPLRARHDFQVASLMEIAFQSCFFFEKMTSFCQTKGFKYIVNASSSGTLACSSFIHSYSYTIAGHQACVRPASKEG